tara:strand:- start:138 stop:359 length:222 start_codon:yes stop_codon:yes gene_type:complete
MLNLKVREGDVIVIDKDIICDVTKANNGYLMLSFDFPEHKSVFREALIEKAKANGTLDELYAKSEQAKLDLVG